MPPGMPSSMASRTSSKPSSTRPLSPTVEGLGFSIPPAVLEARPGREGPPAAAGAIGFAGAIYRNLHQRRHPHHGRAGGRGARRASRRYGLDTLST